MDVLTCSVCMAAAAGGASLAGYVVGRRRRGGAGGVMRSWPGPTRGAPGRRRRTRYPDGRGGPSGGGTGAGGTGREERRR
jgi:hypothetical protein